MKYIIPRWPHRMPRRCGVQRLLLIFTCCPFYLCTLQQVPEYPGSGISVFWNVQVPECQGSGIFRFLNFRVPECSSSRMSTVRNVQVPEYPALVHIIRLHHIRFSWCFYPKRLTIMHCRWHSYKEQFRVKCLAQLILWLKDWPTVAIVCQFFKVFFNIKRSQFVHTPLHPWPY